MNITSLPEEMLREIFSILPFRDLLHCSLICVQWHRIAEPLIYRRACVRIGLDMVGQDQTFWEAARQYHTVIVDNPPCSRRSLVNLLMLPCMVIFKPKEIILRNFVEESLHKFCRHGHRLFEQAESVCVELNDIRHNYPHEDAEEFIFSYPAMKHLVWDQYLLANGRNTMIVDAPLLQTAVVDDSVDTNTSKLHIIRCEQLQHVRCRLRSKSFEHIFCSSFQRLHTLCLDVHNHLCIILPNELPGLKWLELSVNRDFTPSEIENIFMYSKLIGLKLVQLHSETQHPINLNHMFFKLPEIESVELSGLYLDAHNTIDAHNMKLLKMKNIKLVLPLLTFSAPKLEVLSVCENNLITLSIVSNEKLLKKLFVEVNDRDWKKVTSMQLQPFLQMQDSIDELTLVRSNKGILCDSAFFDQPLKIDYLKLHGFDISCDFVENAQHWRHLKRLILSDCCIVCRCKTNQCTRLNDFEGRLTQSTDVPDVVVRRSHKKSCKHIFGKNSINPL
ncbi:uncharacterized protein LOC134217877 [Armigeres subalbatus]|uniref:uncharacterized protein LOC134217877 n=1 Tax=Armigeres subalbatus TaxID=124917 RepID=UPI002ED07A7D